VKLNYDLYRLQNRIQGNWLGNSWESHTVPFKPFHWFRL